MDILYQNASTSDVQLGTTSIWTYFHNHDINIIYQNASTGDAWSDSPPCILIVHMDLYVLTEDVQ